MKSVWEQTGEHRDFAPLKGDISTDVLIIGGGMAGILCAYLLHGAGVPYVLTEAETVCGGITKNTTAKITIQHGLIYDKLLRRFGIGRAGQYLCAQKAALQNLITITAPAIISTKTAAAPIPIYNIGICSSPVFGTLEDEELLSVLPEEGRLFPALELLPEEGFGFFPEFPVSVF